MKLTRGKVHLFKNLSKKKLKSQKQNLKVCPNEMICDLVDAVNAVLNEPNLKITNKQLKRISRFKKFMRGIANKKTKNKRSYITRNMQGGFIASLGPLMATLVSSAIPAIGKLISG